MSASKMLLSNVIYLLTVTVTFSQSPNHPSTVVHGAEDSSTFLTCPINITATEWILPNKIILSLHDVNRNYGGNAEAERIILHPNGTLEFPQVMLAHDGIYICSGRGAKLSKFGRVIFKVGSQPVMKPNICKKRLVQGLVPGISIVIFFICGCMLYKIRSKASIKAPNLPEIDVQVVDKSSISRYNLHVNDNNVKKLNDQIYGDVGRF